MKIQKSKVSAPSRGNWGFLQKTTIYSILLLTSFPPPPEVNGGYYRNWIQQQWANWKEFPPPLEVTGVSHKMAKIGYARVSSFPYPLEVNGGYYMMG